MLTIKTRAYVILQLSCVVYMILVYLQMFKEISYYMYASNQICMY